MSNDFMSFVKNGKVIRGTWKDPNNHKIYAKWLAIQLGYKCEEDWYQITQKPIRDNYGAGLLVHYYNGSPFQLLKTIFPEYEWLEWNFKSCYNGFWQNIENQRRYMVWLGKKLGYDKKEDWYKITTKTICGNGGRGLLEYYNNSSIQLIKTIFPEYEWLEWEFNSTPNGFWAVIENQKRYTDWLGNQLGYNRQEDWYLITGKQIHDNDGSGLLSHYYNDSPIQFVKTMFPEYEWLDWEFESGVPNDFWSNIENQKRYTDWLGNQLGYNRQEDWYLITGKQIHDNDGSGLLSYYAGSPIQFIKKMFPEYEWLEWNFKCCYNGFWQNIENQRRYMVWLGKKLEYNRQEDWYLITGKQIHDNDGSGLLSHYYNNSPIQLIKTIFPEYEWLEWEFESGVSMGFWQNIENHKRYTDWLGKKLGYKCEKDWYQITQKQISDNCGSGLLVHYYNDSPIQFVKKMFPEYEWLEWNFKYCYRGFWHNIENKKIYMNWLGKKLGYDKKEDWYQITQKQIRDNCGGGLIRYYNSSPFQLIKTIFPEYPWKKSKFIQQYSQGQIEWLEYLKLTIPDIRYALSHDGEFKIPNSRYHADGYSENKNLICEYHGDFWHGNPKYYNQEDIHPIAKRTYGDLYKKTFERQHFCENEGYKFIFIWERDWIRGINALVKLQTTQRTLS